MTQEEAKSSAEEKKSHEAWADIGRRIDAQVKRDLGIKDMGKLLPGHGGIMDRIDAMLPAAVAGWIVLTLLA